VIIHLYQQHGLSFTEHLRGEFAFLLYDRRERKVLAVRDRFGIKPLFFNHQDGRFLFASEAKALFATGLLRPAIDVEAIRDFFSMVIPDSVFEGVETIPPGCLRLPGIHHFSTGAGHPDGSDAEQEEGPGNATARPNGKN
jgi:asparagine synthase (glutamine-hydrolysing)